MATTMYFEDTITDQGGKLQMELEIGRSTFYRGAQTPGGIGTTGIYIIVDGNNVTMDLKTAKEFVSSVVSLGRDLSLTDE